MTQAQKIPFKQAYDQDKARYEREMSEFNANGYFTNSKGVCSSTLQVPKKIVQKVESPKKVFESKKSQKMLQKGL